MKTALALIATVLLLWQGLILLGGIPPFLLPSPAAVADALWLNRAEIARNAGFTLLEVMLGFTLGAAIVIALGQLPNVLGLHLSSTATALARHPPFHTVTVRSIENSTPIASQNGNHTQVSIAKIMSRISAK